MASNRGLGSDNMSQADKDKIHRMGGEASGGNHSSSHHVSGAAASKAAQKKGGRNSHDNQYTS